MAITTILFDLDNTLYAYEPAHKASLNAVANLAEHAFETDRQQFLDAFKFARSLIHQRLETKAASHNRMLYAQYTCELLGLPGSAAVKIYDMYWGTFLDAMELRPGVLDFLQHTKAKGYKACIVSDLTAHIQFRKMNKLGLWPYIPLMVTSEETGVEKPNPYPFLLAMNKCGSSAEETVMIGDNPEKDIKGAISLGIRAYHFLDDETPAMEGVFSFTDFDVLKDEL